MHLFDAELGTFAAGGELNEVEHRRPQGGLHDLLRPDLVRRQHAIGAGALQLPHRILGFGAADDVEVGTEQTGRDDDVDVLGVGAGRGDERLARAEGRP